MRRVRTAGGGCAAPSPIGQADRAGGRSHGARVPVCHRTAIESPASGAVTGLLGRSVTLMHTAEPPHTFPVGFVPRRHRSANQEGVRTGRQTVRR